MHALIVLVLFVDLLLYVSVNNFSVMSGQVFLCCKQRLRCLAQGQNAVTLGRLEPATPRSLVKHSTTESLRTPLKELD